MFGECVDAPVSFGRQGRRSAATLQAVRQQPAPAPTVGEQVAQLAVQTSIDLSLLQKVPSALLQGLHPVFLRRAMINAAAAIQDGKTTSQESDPHAEGEQAGQALEDALAQSIMMLPLATRLPLLGKWGPSAIAAAGVPGSNQARPNGGDVVGSGLLPVPGRGAAKRSDGSRVPTATILAEKAAVSFYDFGGAEKAKEAAVSSGARGSSDSIKTREKTKARRREQGLEAAFATVNDFAAEDLPNDTAILPGRLPLLEELNSKRRKAEAKIFLSKARDVGPGEWEAIPAQREQDAKKAAVGIPGNLERDKAAAEEASRASRAVGRPTFGGADDKQADSADAGGWTSAPPARIFTEAGTAVARDGGKSSRLSAAPAEDGPGGRAFGSSRSRSADRDRGRDRDPGYRRGSGGGRSETPPARDSGRELDRRGRRPLSTRSQSQGRGGMFPRTDREGPRPFSDGGRDRSPPRRTASSTTTFGDGKAAAKPLPKPDVNPDAFLRQLGVRNGWAEFVNEKTGEKVFKNVLTGERTNKMPADYRTSISAVMDSRRLNWLAGLRGGGNPFGTIASGVGPPGM